MGGGPNLNIRIGGVFARRYEILNTIGTGRTSAVFKVRDLLAGEVIALKLIRPTCAQDSQVLANFRRELSLARKLWHPNTVRIFDLGDFQGLCFIVMEYVEGRTLAQRLSERGPLPLDEFFEVFHQFAKPLAWLHSQNVIHRDIKPSNVMFTREGQLKLMDFGIAKDLTQNQTTGMVQGTPGFMAPELLLRLPLTPATDIYSTGAMCFELLTGKRPLEDLSPAEVCSRRPPSLHAVMPDATPELARVIERCLEAEPAKRFQSVEELEAAMYAAEGRPAAHAEPVVEIPAEPAPIQPAGSTSHQAPSSRPRIFEWLKAGAIGLVALAAAAGLAWMQFSYVPRVLKRPAAATPAPAPRPPAPVELEKRIPTPTGEMVLVPEGEFLMGEDALPPDPATGVSDEAPAHAVSLGAFYMDMHEVSIRHYSRFLAAAGRPAVLEDEGLPVSGVAWEDANKFCAWAGKRLPSEAEWEKAARGFDDRQYPWGKQYQPGYANLGANEKGQREPAPAGSFLYDASPFGVMDMAGNVQEWVADDYRLYPGNPARLPVSAAGLKVARGGSYAAAPELFRLTRRRALAPAADPGELAAVGFRCAAGPPAAMKLRY